MLSRSAFDECDDASPALYGGVRTVFVNLGTVAIVVVVVVVVVVVIVIVFFFVSPRSEVNNVRGPLHLKMAEGNATVQELAKGISTELEMLSRSKRKVPNVSAPETKSPTVTFSFTSDFGFFFRSMTALTLKLKPFTVFTLGKSFRCWITCKSIMV